MVPIEVAISLCLLGILGGIIVSLVITSLLKKSEQYRIDNVCDVLFDALESEREQYNKFITTERENYEKQLAAFRNSMEVSIEARRLVSEYQVDLAVASGKKEIIVAENKSIEASNKRELETQEQIKKAIADTKVELKRMSDHFRESMKDDITLNLVTCAYAVVLNNHPPRDIKDSELTRAVIEHQRAAKEPVALDKKLPTNDGMN